MATYLNPGSAKFEKTLNSEIYVDKTEMISYLNSVVNTEQCYVCVSRPRRFGKSIAANMLTSYYGKGDSRELFETRKIADCENWDKYLNGFDVIKLVMTDFIKEEKEVKDSLKTVVRRVLDDLSEEYLDVKYDADDLAYSMDRFYRKHDTQFVIIIDEWDAVFRERKNDTEGQKLYLDFLRDWLKDKEYVALAYMTGILPIKKYGKHSALNMFDEYSIIAPLQFAPSTGFTEEEVKELCAKYNVSYDEIKNWYDGYVISKEIPIEVRDKYRAGEYKDNLISVYSPLSVVKAVSSGIIQNYWNKTENYEALAEYIRMDYDGLKDAVAFLMDGGRLKVNIQKYQNDMTTFESSNDVLVMLIHLGYLGYDIETKEAFIPNKEILDEFKNSTDSSEWVEAFESFKKSQKLLNATWNLEAEKVAEILEWFHDGAENKTYNSEAALSYAIQMSYYAAQKYYTTIQELDSGKGYVDLAYLPSPKYPDKPALVIELKYNKTIETAFDQIQARKYPDKLLHYKGNILLVGINYDKDVSSDSKDFKRHSCKIEKV
ncbi:MAG: AAA family ATPase [Lachnospiraceae bacterium]|nr:AAA family ATPase [Lachnospiraceae bacterium]